MYSRNHMLADIYFEKGIFSEAIHLYSRHLLTYPNDAFVYCKRGDAYLAQANRTNAIEDYSKALELDEQCMDARIKLEKILEGKETYLSIIDFPLEQLEAAKAAAEEAVAEAETKATETKATETKATETKATETKATETKATETKATEAVTEAKAVEVNAVTDTSKKTNHMLADIYFEKGIFSEAIHLYSRHLLTHPKDALVYCKRGDAYLAQANRTNAIEDYSKALELDEQCMDARIKLEKILEDRANNKAPVAQQDVAINTTTLETMVPKTLQPIYIPVKRPIQTHTLFATNSNPQPPSYEQALADKAQRVAQYTTNTLMHDQSTNRPVQTQTLFATDNSQPPSYEQALIDKSQRVAQYTDTTLVPYIYSIRR